MRGADSLSFITQLAPGGHCENLVRLHASTVLSEYVYRYRMCQDVFEPWFHSMQKAVIYIDLFQLSQIKRITMSTYRLVMSMMILTQGVVPTKSLTAADPHPGLSSITLPFSGLQLLLPTHQPSSNRWFLTHTSAYAN